MRRSKILGTGSYLPSKQLTNADLEKMVDTNNQWIVERTGISSRRVAASDQVTSDLALEAAKSALDSAGLGPKDIDIILFATVSPDQVMPNTACILQHKLGTRTVMSLDISAACSGFVYGISIADQFIKTGAANHVLVVGAEILTRYVNYRDRESCILFGDGAGAIIMGPTEENSKSQILSHHLRGDGSIGDLFVLPAGGTKIPFSQQVLDEELQYLKMKGREIFKHAVRTMSEACFEALRANGMSGDEIEWIIPHQANVRIMDAVAKLMNIPLEKFVNEISQIGNTSAASIPLALDRAVRDGRIQRGQNVILTAFGAGITSGSILMRY